MKRERSITILKIFILSLWWALLELTTSFYGLLSDYRVVQTKHVFFRLLVSYQNIVGNDFLPEIQKAVNLPSGNELQLPLILLGDSAFPPFENTLSRKQSHFNYCSSGKNGKNGNRIHFLDGYLFIGRVK